MLLLLFACPAPSTVDSASAPFETGETGAPAQCTSLRVYNGSYDAHNVDDAEAFCDSWNAVSDTFYASVPVNCLCEASSVYAFDGARFPALRRTAFLNLKTNAEHLHGYRSLESVSYKLSIEDSPNLVDLDGLQNLTEAFDVEVVRNGSLTSLRGLDTTMLQSADLDIADNPSLTDLSGLEGLTSCQALKVSGNERLASLEQLGSLTHTTKWLSIGDNPKLTSLAGLEQFEGTEEVYLDGNTSLTDVSALTGITADGLHLAGNTSLTSLGTFSVQGLTNVRIEGNQLSTLEPLGGWTSLNRLHLDEAGLQDLHPLSKLTAVETLTLGSTDHLEHLIALERIDHTLTLFGPRVTDLSALSHLRVARRLRVNSTALSTLAGLEGLRNMREVIVRENPALTDVMALATVQLIHGDLIIEDNPALTNAAALVEAIGEDNIGGSIRVQGYP